MPLISETYRQKIKEALKLAAPIVIGQLGLVLMGFFDTVQVGGLGSVYMAASGVSNSVYFLFNLLGMGVLFAVSPLVSEALGERHGWKAIGVMRSALKVALALSVFFYCIMVVVTQHFSLFKESAHITDLSQRFLTILNYSTPALMFFTVGKQFMDGQGRTKVSMVITLIGVVCNVLLNWILIYGKLGCPALGIEGAAIATGTSRALMCIMLAVYIIRDAKIKALIKEFRFSAVSEKSYVKQILIIGIPSGLQMFFEVAAFSAGQIMCGWISESSLAAYQVAISLASITFMMVSGIAAAGTIMSGYAFGSKDNASLRVTGNSIYLLTFCSQFIFAIIFFLFSNLLPQMYTGDKEVISIASSLIILAAIFQLSDGFQVAGSGILRGMQDVRIPSIIAFTSYWLIMVPLCYILAFNFKMGVNGVWVGFVVGLSIAAVLMYARFRYKLKHIEFSEL